MQNTKEIMIPVVYRETFDALRHQENDPPGNGFALTVGTVDGIATLLLCAYNAKNQLIPTFQIIPLDAKVEVRDFDVIPLIDIQVGLERAGVK